MWQDDVIKSYANSDDHGLDDSFNGLDDSFGVGSGNGYNTYQGQGNGNGYVYGGPGYHSCNSEEKKTDFDFKISLRDSKPTADKTELSERAH